MQNIECSWVFRVRLPDNKVDNQAELRGRDHGRFSIPSKMGMRMGREYYNVRVHGALKNH